MPDARGPMEQWAGHWLMSHLIEGTAMLQQDSDRSLYAFAREQDAKLAKLEADNARLLALARTLVAVLLDTGAEFSSEQWARRCADAAQNLNAAIEEVKR